MTEPAQTDQKLKEPELAGLPNPATFPHDCPGFWFEIYKLRRETHTFDSTLTQILKNLGDTFSSTNTSDYEGLKGFMDEHSKGKASDGTPFSDFALTMGQLGIQRAKLEKAFKDWHETAATQSNEVQRLNAKLEDHNANKKKYNEKMQKYLGYKYGEKVARMQKTGKKIVERRQQLEIQRFDIDAGLKNLQLGQEIALLKPMGGVLESYLTFCKEAVALLEPLQAKISELQTYVKSQQEDVETKRQLIAKAKRDFEAKANDQLQEDTDVFLRGIEQTTHGSGVRDLDAQDNTGIKRTEAIEKEGQLYVPAPNFIPVWCVLKNGTLSIEKAGTKDTKLDLMLCTVKENRTLRMRFIFNVISPSTTLLLQAESMQEMTDWMACIQNAISAGLNKGEKSPVGEDPAALKAKDDLSQQLAILRAVEGNDKCADCDQADPDWLSLNLGILMCVNCSGVHRSLGVHISKVRSCTLDKIDPSQMAFMQCIGNTKANSIWEAAIKDGKGRPNRSSNRAMREMWIKAKYELKSFLGKKNLSGDEANAMLFEAIATNQPLEMLRALAWGADPNWKNDKEEKRTALHQAVSFGSLVSVEVMIQNQGNLNAREMRGWTPLHYAAYQDDSEIGEVLLQRGGIKLALATDIDGLTPHQIAIQYYDENSKAAQLLGDAEKKAKEQNR